MDAQTAKCSKCSGPLDTDRYPRWCRKCKAQYQREYQALKRDMTESRGYADGVADMRAHLAQKFEGLGGGTFSGTDAAQWVRNEAGPS